MADLVARPPAGPTGAQRDASDPAGSVWVGANAGSGKTRVLTQRVARLLLAGSAPERILCLTYTRAAAAEMQNRLFSMLGGWAMLGDAELAAALAELEGGEVPPPARLAEARRLFARALETPGGLKIQTIHAFSAALLRRFPLEAGVSPRFSEADERQTALLTRTIRAEMAEAAGRGEEDAFDRIAARLDETGVDGLVAAILGRRGGFEGTPFPDRLAARFAPDVAAGAEAAARACLARLDWTALAPLEAVLRAAGGANDQAAAAALRAAREGAADPCAALEGLTAAYLRKDGEPRAARGFPVAAVLKALPAAADLTEGMKAWAVEARDALMACEVAARAGDLDAFARAFLRRYTAAKTARGLLDFDDLIQRTRELLTSSDMAAWALWKLDGGIDHILVDEAQDTSPAQWDVVKALAREFFAGRGARDVTRTLFVVGDEKQSIYSFQGAEPRAFGETREEVGRWLEGLGPDGGPGLRRPDLVTSFRSSQGILDFVDAVFEGDAAAGLTTDGRPPRHEAHRAGDGFRVDLWPPLGRDDAAPDREWWVPLDVPPRGDPRLRLARALAAEIARMIREDRRPSRGGAPGARVRAGDILVLVRRRDLLAGALVRELKALGVPVAGADRMALAGELAVRDLLAAVKVAVTPGDDLSLAALLRSPLGGLSEEELFDLAHGRRGTLLARLRAARERHQEAAAFVDDLAARADYLRPYEFLERILVHHDGRRRLLARLGTEAEDSVDELLAQALAFEAGAPPSLAGFVEWVEAGEITVKREMDHGAGEVRVMTVHGAKGLEAPVVILPDTTGLPGGGGGQGRQTLLEVPGGGNAPPLTLWAGPKGGDDRVTRAAREDARRRELEEYRRLLYVGLTRAEDWLIVCGAGQPKAESWYALAAAGADRMGGSVEVPAPAGIEGMARRFGEPGAGAGGASPEAAPDAAPAAAPDAAPDVAAPDAAAADTGAPLAAAAAPHEAGRDDLAPAWLRPAPAEPRPRRIAPSGLVAHPVSGDGRGAPDGGAPDGGARTGEAPAGGGGRDAALAHGSAVHALLEHLPRIGAEARAGLAARLLAGAPHRLDAGAAAAALAEAEGVLAAPFAGIVFGPGSRAEAGIAAWTPAGRMLGRADRVVIAPDAVTVIDFKTDREVPADPAATPAAYLAQLGAYRAALSAIFPGRAVTAAILWTRVPALVALPGGLVDAAWGRALASPDPA